MGVRIYEWTPGFCHAKMSVADDCMATCGTINLDYRSLYHHFENGCFMADCDAVLDIRRDMEQTLEQCREVTEKYKSGRSATLRLGQLFLTIVCGAVVGKKKVKGLGMQVCISGSFYSCILTYIEMRYIIKPRRKQIFLHSTIESRYIMKANIRKEQSL